MNKKGQLSTILLLAFSITLLIISMSLGTKILEDVDNNFADGTNSSAITANMLTKFNVYAGGPTFKILIIALIIPLAIYMLNLFNK